MTISDNPARAELERLESRVRAVLAHRAKVAARQSLTTEPEAAP